MTTRVCTCQTELGELRPLGALLRMLRAAFFSGATVPRCCPLLKRENEMRRAASHHSERRPVLGHTSGCREPTGHLSRCQWDLSTCFSGLNWTLRVIEKLIREWHRVAWLPPVQLQSIAAGRAKPGSAGAILRRMGATRDVAGETEALRSRAGLCFVPRPSHKRGQPEVQGSVSLPGVCRDPFLGAGTLAGGR